MRVHTVQTVTQNENLTSEKLPRSQMRKGQHREQRGTTAVSRSLYLRPHVLTGKEKQCTNKVLLVILILVFCEVYIKKK